MASWRLIESGWQDAYTNMAQDEALLLENSHGQAPPVLRFYSWQPGAVSIGYAQEVEWAINHQAAQKRKLDVVRRPTGGRGVLHQEELTYSVVAPQALFPPGVVGSYRAISKALLLGLRKLGIKGELTGKAGERGISACFLTSLSYEITVQGRKIIGSAQRRQGLALLQQGSILLKADYQALAETFIPPPNTSGESWLQRMRGKVGCLAELLGRLPEREEVREVICAGFKETFGAEFIPGEPTIFEQRLCKKLRAEKYRTHV